MFKVIKENKIIGVSEQEPTLLDKYNVEEDTEHTISDYMQVNCEYVLTSSAEAIEQKKADVRAVRNSYLVKYVDPKQLVLVWDGLEEDKRQDYADYRQYLLDYTEREEWYEQPPMTFEEWKQKPELEQIVASGD